MGAHYVRLYVDILDNDSLACAMSQSRFAFPVFAWCLIRAGKGQSSEFSASPTHISGGAHKLGLTPDEMEQALTALDFAGIIQKRENVIHIPHWSKWQSDYMRKVELEQERTSPDAAPPQGSTSDLKSEGDDTAGQAADTTKQTKQDSRAGGNKDAKVFSENVEKLFALGVSLFQEAGHKTPSTAAAIIAAKDVLRLMLDADKIDPYQIDAGLRFVNSDTGRGDDWPGWRKVCQSFGSLRAKWEKIAPQIKTPKKPEESYWAKHPEELLQGGADAQMKRYKEAQVNV